MPDNNHDLLNYYHEELAYVRHEAQTFAKRYPHVASHLHLSPDVIEDPHVNRLIEAFALLNSRIRCQLDAHFPALVESLLDVIYPEYLTPIPSMSTIQFTPQDSLTGGFLLAKGTKLETPPTQGEPCQFTTCYDTTIWPISVATAQCTAGATSSISSIDALSATQSHLTLTLSCMDTQQRFDALAPDKLRLHIKGTDAMSLSLYEYLFSHCLGVSVINPDQPQSPIYLGSQAIDAVGFGENEAMRPWSTQDFTGHRLLLEFFTFKAKFLFFDLCFDQALKNIGNTLVLQFHFKTALNSQLQLLHAGHLALNCTPIINLFTKMAEPLVIDGKQDQYPIIVDKRHPQHYTALQVKRVDDITDVNAPKTLTPLYGIGHHHQSTESQWFTHRSYEVNNVGQMHLAVTDGNTKQMKHKILQIHTDSFNGDIPQHLAFPNEVSHFQLAEGAAPVSLIQSLSQPTPVYRQHLDHQGKLPWQFISKLSLNYHHLLHDEQALATLHETLSLYNLGQQQGNNQFITSIVDVQAKQTMKRIPGGMLNPFTYGHEVTVYFDEDKTTTVSPYLFAKVLEQFLSYYHDMNSFIDFRTATRPTGAADV